jgi:hypothetical protein
MVQSNPRKRSLRERKNMFNWFKLVQIGSIQGKNLTDLSTKSSSGLKTQLVTLQTEAEAKRGHIESHCRERRRRLEEVKKYQVSRGPFHKLRIYILAVFRIRIHSGQWIRIRNLDPDPGGQKWPTKVEKIKKFNVLFWALKASSVAMKSFMEV